MHPLQRRRDPSRIVPRRAVQHRVAHHHTAPFHNQLHTGGGDALSDAIPISCQYGIPVYKISFQISNDVALVDLYLDIGAFAYESTGSNGAGGVIHQTSTTVTEIEPDTSVVEYYIVAQDEDEYMTELETKMQSFVYYKFETARAEKVEWDEHCR